jgi:phosphinothricin acetyltransferase
MMDRRQEVKVQIRDANLHHAEAIAAIYNDAVQNTTAIWNEVVVDTANRAKWLTGRQGMGYPVIVAVADDGGVVGYASFGDWRAFDGYRHTVEHSVYVDKNQRGAGIGKALMVALIERARQAGKHVMVAGIEAGNLTSIQLHNRLGFVQTGLMKEVGTKFGRWLDLAFFQLQLDDRAMPD